MLDAAVTFRDGIGVDDLTWLAGPAYCHVTMASATTVTLLSFAADTAFASTAMADTTVRFQITYEAA